MWSGGYPPVTSGASGRCRSEQSPASTPLPDSCGSAREPTGPAHPHRRTRQRTLEAALSRLHGDAPVRVRGAGRTDAGVHARGQVADCELTTDKKDDDALHALRCMLPADVAALDLRTVPPTFHSQRDAAGKTYRYLLDLTRHGDPLSARYALRLRHR
ncbi:MAG: tRNA pseudouridine synthase A, partial [Planctomycetota bacterium]